jgi:hypothetical protein
VLFFAVQKTAHGKPAILPLAKSRYAYNGVKLPLAISHYPLAPGIAAESPQDLHWQIRGLAAESPVSGASRRKGALPFSPLLCNFLATVL